MGVLVRVILRVVGGACCGGGDGSGGCVRGGGAPDVMVYGGGNLWGEIEVEAKRESAQQVD